MLVDEEKNSIYIKFKSRFNYYLEIFYVKQTIANNIVLIIVLRTR